MKKHLGKRFLSTLLAAVMILTMLPMSVFAMTADEWDAVVDADGLSNGVLTCYAENAKYSGITIPNLINGLTSTDRYLKMTGSDGSSWTYTAISYPDFTFVHGVTYTVYGETNTGKWYSPSYSWNSTGTTFTVSLYDKLTINTTIGDGETTTDYQKVTRGTTYSATAASVTGYSRTVENATTYDETTGVYTASGLTGDRTINIKYTINSYKVTWDAGDGTWSGTNPVVVTYGEKIPTPANPVSNNKTLNFDTWVSTTYGAFVAGETTMPAYDVTYVAKYVDKPVYAVTFNSNGGSDVEAQNITEGQTVIEPTDPTKDNATFAGWYKDSTFATAWDFANDTVTAKTTLYAKWLNDGTVSNGSIGSATVTYTVDGAEVESGAYVDYGKTVTISAERSGDNKYITKIEVVGNGSVVASKNINGATGSMTFTVGDGVAYTVNVTTADAIVLSGTTIDYNNANKTSYDVLESYIEDLVVSIAGSTNFGDLTVTYDCGVSVVTWGGYQSLNYSPSGLTSAHAFGNQSPETVRITDGTYTWTGTIYLEDQRPDAFTVKESYTLTSVDVENDDAIKAQAKLALENWQGGLTADSTLVSYSIGAKPTAAGAGNVIVTVSVADDTSTAYKSTTGKTVTVPVTVTEDPSTLIVTNETAKGEVVLTGANGAVTDSSYADTLTMTVKPESGYYVKKITVNDVEQSFNYTTTGGIVSIDYTIANGETYAFAVEYGDSITVNGTNGTGSNAGKFVVPFNGYYSAAEQEAALESAIFDVLINTGTGVVVHNDASYTIEVYDGGYFSGWRELSVFTDAAAYLGASFNANSTRRVRLSWDATNMHPAYEKEFNVYFAESRLTDVALTYIGGTKTGKTTDDITVANTEVSVSGDNVNVGAVSSVTYKSGSMSTEPNGTSTLTFTVVVGENEYYTKISKDISVTAKVTTYTIEWDTNGDGEADVTDYVAHGVTPTAPAASKEADAQYTYTFKEWDSEVVAADGDKTYTALFNNSTNTYTVKWVIDGETKETDTGVAYGDTPTYDSATPTKDSTAQYTYTFEKWVADKNVASDGTITGDVTFIANFTATTNTYTVIWKNGDDVLETDANVAYGTTPSYDKEEPTKASTAEYNYTFTDWSPEISSVTGDAVYTAQFEEKKRSYDITWNAGVGTFEDDSTSKTISVEYGTVPTAPEEPTKAADAQTEWKFSGWTPAVSSVTGITTYTANYVPGDAVMYTVTWYDEDETTVLDTAQWAYGSTPSFAGTSPTKAATAQYTYAFDKWVSVSNVDADGKITGAATYKASYTETVNEYTITFKNGENVLQTGKVAYGTVPTYNGENPTKAATAQYTFSFEGWDPEVVAVTGEAVYTAIFTETVNEYTISWDYNGDKVADDTTKAAYGEVPTHSNPEKEYYTFTGWTPVLTSVTGDTTYTATWEITNDSNDNNVPDELETVTVTIAGNAAVTIDGNAVSNGASYIYDSTKTDNVIVVTPSDLKGEDGSAEYVNSCSITGGTYSGGVYTVTTDLNASGLSVEIGPASLINQGGTLELNGYVKDGIIDDYSARWNNIKSKVLNAVLGGYDNIGDYTVYLWLDLSLSEAQYHDVSGNILQKDRLNVPTYGSTGTQKVKIVKAASDDGKIVALTLADINVRTKESREPAQVGIGSAVSGNFDTLDAFKSAITNSIWVKDNNNADCKVSAGLSITLTAVEGKTNTYTVSYSLANDGATWLTTSGTLAGEVVWNVSVYKVKFLNDDGTTVLSEKEYPYGTTADQIETPTATKANEVDSDGNIIARYTFAAWDPTVDTVTGVATYTATYNRVVEKYTITWVNGDKSTTEEYEYGAMPVAPTASKSDKTDDAGNVMATYTDGAWPTLKKVTGNVSYTATFTEVAKEYTITWVNGDETTTEKYKYGETPVAPTASKTSTAQYHFTNGTWGTIATVTGDASYTATFTEELRSYTITWSIKGETTTETKDYGEKITHDDIDGYVTDEAAYTFKGWKVGDSESVINGSDLPEVTGDVTITAVFSSNPVYQVTVNPDNGTGTTSNPVENGETFIVPAVPSKSGYRFMKWLANSVEVEAGAELTISEATAITAVWAELFTITWMNDGEVYLTETDKYIAGETPVASADPGKAADAQYTYTFDRWTPAIGEITGDTTYTAVYSNTVNQYTVTFTDENGTELNKQTLDYGDTPVYGGTTPVKEYYSWAWDKTIATVTGNATYKLVWTANNDSNTNGVADELETGTVTVTITGNGSVALAPAGSAMLLKQEGNVYTYLYDSTDAANKVINVTATPTDTTATDGNVDYIISAPTTVNVGETVTVKFGTHTLNANNGEFGMNGSYDHGLTGDNKAFETLKADVLNAAGLDGANAANYTVKMKYSAGELNLDEMPGILNINAGLFFTAIELPESARQFVITDNTTGVSKTVRMKITDSRDAVDPQSITVSEQKDLGYMTNDNILADVKSVVGELSLGTPSISAGALPVNAGDLTSVTYSVSFNGDANYQAATIYITYEKVYKAYNDCTVSADSSLTANGSMTINGDTDATVPGNSTVTITVKPNSDKIVERITVTNKTTGETVTVSAITYSSQSATVTFTSGGATTADEYVVSATYSDKYLNLQSGTIVYCVDDKDHTYDLQKLVFEAIFGGSCAPMTKDNVKLEYQYAGGDLIKLWADVSKDPSINIDGISHKFGEDGSETIKLTYSDDKYGSFEQQIELNVFDSCYSVTVGVNTVTNGADATIKTQYSADTREYMNQNYFKAGTELTVTLTPDGELLDVLAQMYNGTYAEEMAYIKSVTVTDKNGNVVEATLTRGQGKLSLDSILSGVNPMLFNAAVTFTLEADEQYTVTVEYGIHAMPEANDAQLPMYQGGADYVAEVPTAEELVNAILGEDKAAAFLATYGGAYTVEFTNALLANEWTAVSDEALLALSDGSKITVRITWKPGDTNMIYYPVATTAEVTLVDLRTPTSVQGEVPSKQVNFLSEDELIAELKEALGLGILANSSLLDVDYTVTYTLKGNETDGFFADVTVSYDGSADYKPTSKTFENVPVANRPDDATIKVTIQNASDVVTNNDDKIQTLDTTTGTYTVIGNGTYNFKFTPATGYAIESVTVNGDKVELTYSKQVASFSMVLNEEEYYDVVVETISSAWVLEEEPSYDFATGIDTPDNGDIVEDITTYPTDIDFEKVTLEYLARSEGKVTVTLPDIDLGFTVIELGTFDIDLGELWLNPEESVDMVSEDQLDKILENLVNDIIYQVSMGELDATKAFDYIQTYVKNLPLGIHAFGVNGDGSTETVRFSYEDDKYLLAQVQTDVSIHDYRIATEIAASDCEVTFGYSLDQLIAAAGANVTADGAIVSGLKIETDDLYKHVGTHEIKLTFAGDVNYQPSKVTINVTVNKAACSIDYDSQMITYGDEYELVLSVSPTTMPDGTTAEIDRIEFMIGLDASKLLDLDVDDGATSEEVDKSVGLNQAVGEIRIRLPQSIRELPLVGQYLQGEFTLGEFTNLINSLSDLLGIDESSMETLNKVVEAITGFTDNLEIKIIVRDEDFHPTNVGVYIAGAVTVDTDFETAYTADYLIIAPKTIETELAWDYTDSNGIMTLPVYNEIFKDMMGAHVVETETITGETLDIANGHVKYLILGINDETSEFLTTDVYGTIKANIWTSNEAITDNGAYVQIAYMLNWGNEIYYAVPLVRTFVIVPATVDVQLVGATGTANNDLLKEFNNEAQGFNVIVTNNEGKIVYSDHYQNLKDNGAEVTYTYVGIQTNGQPYNSTEMPVHAGAYAVVVTYVEKDGEDILAVGADAGVLVIEPTESTITVNDVIVEYEDTNRNIAEMLDIQVGSTVENLTPDTTIITASIASNGDFSENGWEAVDGVVNVDFPDWVDELIAQYAPSVQNGITVAELNDKLISKMPEISDALVEAGIDAEIVDILNQAMTEISNVLAEMPEDLELTFTATEELVAKSVGAYVVIGVVTDSDHYPSVDAGALVIVPAITQVELKWNHEDTNGIWTRELLKYVDLNATAFNKDSNVINDEATAKITYQFIGVNKNGELVVYTDGSSLTNGAYIEMAYIELELGGEMTISDMIARPVVIVPNTTTVEFVDGNGTVNHDRKFVFDNTAKTMGKVVVTDSAGNIITPADGELTVTYTGLQTNVNPYNSTEPPVHAGAYLVTATYIVRDSDGNLSEVGVGAGVMVIEPTTSTIEVENKVLVEAKGEYAFVNDLVTATSTVENLKPDTTVISAMVAATGEFSEVGLEAVEGNVNVDFPKWLDELLAEYAPEIKDGITAAEFIDLINAKLPEISDKLAELGVDASVTDILNEAAASVVEMIEKLPIDTSLTFKDNVKIASCGVYLVVGIVTDSDHYPSMDAGIVAIVPDVTQVYLKFNYEDANNLWTNDLLKTVDKKASAYTDDTYTTKDDAATEKISYKYLTVDSEANLIEVAEEDLTTGVYVQLAYIELELDGKMTVSDLIARVIVAVPDMVDVTLEGDSFVYDGTAKSPTVVVKDKYGAEINYDPDDLVMYYIGIEGDIETYYSTEAPSQAGAYMVVALHLDPEAVGATAGTMVINKTDSGFVVESTPIAYDEQSHFAVVTNPNGVDYLSLTMQLTDEEMNVSLVMPQDLDEHLAKLPQVVQDAIGKLADKIGTEIQVSELKQLFIDILAELNAVELPESVPASLTQFFTEVLELMNKAESMLDFIPDDGVVTIGTHPSAVGKYTAFALSLSANYATTYSTNEYEIYCEEHQFGDWYETLTPACETPGEQRHDCEVPGCDHFEAEVLEALGHDLVKYAEDAATCTEKGTIYYECDREGCTYTETAETDATGHALNEVKAKDPTCTEAGNKVYYTCSNEGCDKVFKDAEGTEETTVEGETIPATGHELIKTEAKDSTCTETGNYEYYTCTTCGEFFKDAEGTVGTTVEAETIPTAGHKMTKTDAKPATCTATGNNVYYTCSTCDKVFKDENGETETTVEYETIAKAAHSLTKIDAQAATCTESGSNTYYTCGVCGKLFADENGTIETSVEAMKTSALGHDYGAWTIVNAATCMSEGEEQRTCQREGCNHTESRTTAVNSSAHAYGEITFKWADDYSSCMATVICAHNSEHSITKSCDVGCQTNDATCEGQGTKIYTATITDLGGKAGSNEVVVTLAALGHEYELDGNSEKKWSSDETGHWHECTRCHTKADVAVHKPDRDAADEENAKVCTICGYVIEPKKNHEHSYTQQDDKHLASGATCTEDAVYYYNCSCGVQGEETYTKANTKLGHDLKLDSMGTSFEWSEDYSACVAHVYCARCKQTVSKDCTVTMETTDATCTAAGKIVYTASITVGKDSTTRKKNVEIPVKDHTAGEAVTENEDDATCTTGGSYDTVVYCTVCDAEISRENTIVPATGHTAGEAVTEKVVAATCTADGSYDTVVYCTVCGAEISRTTTVVPAAHKDEDGDRKCDVCDANLCTDHTAGEAVKENEVAATCTKEGSYETVVYCSVCGVEISRETTTVPATGHTESEAVTENEVAATCTKEGSYDSVVYCTVCKAELSRKAVTVSATGHTAGEAVKEEEVAATCTADGSYDTVVYCSVCRAEISRVTTVVPAIGHSYTESVTKEPTCTEAGVKTFTCEHNSKHFYTESIDPLGHTAGEAVIENEKTDSCTAGSYDSVVYCTVCKTEISRETIAVSAAGHAESEAVVENEKAATCTADGSYDTVVYCSVCDVEISRETTTVPATGHTESEAVKENEVAASCTADGSYDTVVYCSVCDAEISRETTTVPATGHAEAEAVKENEVAATCTADGSYDTVVYCSVCGVEISRETTTVPATGHTESKAVTENEKAATCTADGSYDTVVYCTVCGAEISRTTTVVPAAHKDENGDRKCDVCDANLCNDHTDGEAMVENEVTATCTTDGSYDTVVYCTVCGAEISREVTTVPATGHTAGEAVKENEVAATCTKEGSYDSVVYCTVCNAEISREAKSIPAKGHVDADGNYKCDVCNADLCTDHTQATREENREEATCTTEGSYTLVTYCSVCGHVISSENKVIPMKDHVDTDGDYKCDGCGKNLCKEHVKGEPKRENEKPATCTEDGSYESVVYCKNCGVEISRETIAVSADGHSYGDPKFNWQTDYSAAKATVTVNCGDCDETGKTTLAVDCKITCKVEGNTLKFTATAELPNGQIFTDDTQYIKVTRVAVDKITIEMSLVEKDASANMFIMIAGYENSGKMMSCQMESDVTGTTTITLTVTGNVVRIFFLDPATYAPLMLSLQLL